MRSTQAVTCLLAFAAGLALTACTSAAFPREEKMKPAELIARHLDSIGKAEARSAVRNQEVAAKVNAIFRLGSSLGQFTGTGSIISQAPMIRYAMNFNREDYPGEQMVFDGRKVSEATLRPAVRSDLTKIVHDYDFILKEGLLGGTLSSTWCLLDPGARQAKLDYRGIKKIDGRQLHELRIQPKGSSNWNVFLYFEPETFRHVLSTYELKVQPYLAGRIDESARQADSYWRLREQFADFKETDGITIPMSYTLRLTFDSPDHPFITTWEFRVTEVHHNQPLDASVFTIR